MSIMGKPINGNYMNMLIKRYKKLGRLTSRKNSFKDIATTVFSQFHTLMNENINDFFFKLQNDIILFTWRKSACNV